MPVLLEPVSSPCPSPVLPKAAPRRRHTRAALAAFCVLFLLTFRPCTLAGWDEGFYWAQLTSLWHDGDLRLHDDLLATWDDPAVQARSVTRIYPSGALGNTFSVGPAVVQGLWAGPAVLVARLLGLPRLHQGVLAAAAVGAFLQLWIVFLLQRHLLRLLGYPLRLRWPVGLCILFGTPLAWYGFRAYSMSHLLSGLLATAFVAVSLRWLRRPTMPAACAVGLTAGLMAVTRWQDILLGVFLLPPLVGAFRQTEQKEPAPQALLIRGLAVAAFAAAGVLAIQMIAWHKQFGFWVGMPQGSGYMQWTSPRLVPFLFSGYHGLLPWSPVLAVACAGLLAGTVRRTGFPRLVFAGALMAVAVQLYINACVADWWGGASYGARRTVSLLPFFSLGLAEVFVRWTRPAVLTVTAAVLLYAQFTLQSYTVRVDDLSVPLLGRRSADAPSLSPGEQRAYVLDGKEARKVLRKELSPDLLKPPLLVKDKGRKALFRTLALVAVVGTCFAAHRGMFVLLRSRRGRRMAVAAVGLWTAFHLVGLAVRVPSNKDADEAWREFVRGAASGESAKKGGVPEVAVDLVAAVRVAQAGEEQRAQSLLAPYRSRFFPKAPAAREFAPGLHAP